MWAGNLFVEVAESHVCDIAGVWNVVWDFVSVLEVWVLEASLCSVFMREFCGRVVRVREGEVDGLQRRSVVVRETERDLHHSSP